MASMFLNAHAQNEIKSVHRARNYTICHCLCAKETENGFTAQINGQLKAEKKHTHKMN